MIGVRSTSVTAKTLSENTPFHAQDGLLYNGEKFSKLYEIDLNDGQLLNDFTSSPSMPPFTKSESSTVIVGRVDYVIRAYNTATGQQEVFFSFFDAFYNSFSSILLMGNSLQSQVVVNPFFMKTVPNCRAHRPPIQSYQKNLHPQIHLTIRSENVVPQNLHQQPSFIVLVPR